MKKTLLGALLALSLLAVGTVSFAEPIRHDEDCVPVWLYVASWVEIGFDTATPFFIDIEAGDTASANPDAVKTFTVRRNCKVTVTGALTEPALAPAGLTWQWYFNNVPGTHSFNLNGPGTSTKTVTIVASGNNINTIPAGLWTTGQFCVIVDAFDDEPDTTPFPL